MKNIIYLLALLMAVGCTTGIKPTSDTKGAFLNFQKPEENPIMSADSSYTFLCPIKNEVVQWQKADVFNPAAIVKDNKIHMLFRAEDNPEAILGGRTSRIGLATSEDGLYVMAYTSWNNDVARLSIAHSTDLINWEKKGPAFASAYEGKFLDRWSKSGSIITKLEGENQVVVKIDGKYWMYWGEQFINLAWSENLYDWYPTLDDKGELKAIIETRPGYFDSMLTECGPPAVITEEGIVLLYNGKNSDNDDASPDLPRGTYSVGKIVFDPADPEEVLFRSDTCLLRPTLSHELTGQYKSGTTFAEGLVYYNSRWFLYYGTADSYVGVAISE